MHGTLLMHCISAHEMRILTQNQSQGIQSASYAIGGLAGGITLATKATSGLKRAALSFGHGLRSKPLALQAEACIEQRRIDSCVVCIRYSLSFPSVVLTH